jgi:hypothetical protein
MGYLYQQVCCIFKFESFNTAHHAFHSIINEKKDVVVNLTTGAENYLFNLSGSHLSYLMQYLDLNI